MNQTIYRTASPGSNGLEYRTGFHSDAIDALRQSAGGEDRRGWLVVLAEYRGAGRAPAIAHMFP